MHPHDKLKYLDFLLKRYGDEFEPIFDREIIRIVNIEYPNVVRYELRKGPAYVETQGNNASRTAGREETPSMGATLPVSAEDGRDQVSGTPS